MVMKVALDLIPKGRIDEYAEMNCHVFGDILLEAMGYNASCAAFTKRADGKYNIDYALDDGAEFSHTLVYEDIRRALEGKSLTLTTSVKTRE